MNFSFYELVGGQSQRMSSNNRAHYAIPPMGVEVSKREGTYQNQTQLWPRW
ncbi:MAG: hypothetical protein IGS48_21140 [Oscillatoriales cyanobacterium C42_A2020_001]|nr:hypothetical protein [Leptolyngbyaceae cyanobacterium C42_A2020_001]